MAGGSYLVARRIRMHIEIWDRTTLQEQQDIIGRDKGEGAPLGQKAEFDTLDFDARRAPTASRRSRSTPTWRSRTRAGSTASGSCVVATTSPTAPTASGTSTPGLFFIGFMRDAHKQFVPMQRALAAKDGLNEYIEHTGSAVFACPPGLGPDEYWGQDLFS